MRAPPRASARLQLHRGFTLRDAREQVRYYAALGVSHLYLSPILSARAGSMHGYDVVDPGAVNPELGGEEALRGLVAELRHHGLGLIVDIVPNHMAVGGDDNRWWLDVLEHGRASRYARFFDIDWEVPDPALRGKVLLPFLGVPYGEALHGQDLRLEEQDGRWSIRYFEHRFPLRPRDAARARAVAAARTADALHALLERQHWRLAHWRTAADEINWRRFFDITSLAGLRVEEPRVFEAVHAKILALYREGLIDGLRVDHVDGLADPRGYCRTLRARLERLARRRPPTPWPEPYLVIEKILAPGEPLREDWRVHGSTGYSFMNEVGALLTDPTGEAPLTELWESLSGRPGDFTLEQRAARRRVLDELLSADFGATALALHRVARSEPATRDVTLPSIRRVLTELLVHFPVYRLYAGLSGRAAADESVMARVREAARPVCRPAERPLVDLIDRWLGGEAPTSLPPGLPRKRRLRAIARFQQLSSPLAAKSVEDTAFYRHGRLLSRNEVGADPAQFALDPPGFHAASQRRLAAFPHALLATATHDHKRGEDLRARLAVLSEIPAEWAAAVQDWRTRNARWRRAVSAADEYMLYQMLVGAWPLGLAAGDRAGLRAFGERIALWQQKALREAKLRSSWVEPDAEYEAANRGFLDSLLDPARPEPFPGVLAGFAGRLAPAGALNGLVQAALRLTAPGVPDLYQGTEFWDFSLVDPDNRRPVDYVARAAARDAEGSCSALLEHWTDGRVKQRLVAELLALRAQAPDVFARGEYLPLEVTGNRAGRVVAFARQTRDEAVIVLAPRLASAGLEDGRPRIAASWWGDTALRIPAGLRGPAREVLLGADVRLGDRLPLASALDRFSLAVFRRSR